MIRIVCLSETEIADYLQGRLPEDLSEEIEVHLSQCERCDSAARRLDQSGDSLVRHLRLSPETTPQDESWQSCLTALRSLPEQVAPPTDSPESISLEQAIRPDSVYHYQLGPQLGRGGMGVVYRSWHPQLHRPVAVKILSAARSTDAASIARFQREMRAAGALDHPGIVRAVDAGLWKGTYYLVMEFIDGVDLSRLVHRGGPVSPKQACAIAIQAAEALQFAHQHQVIHRDIKPSNLMLTRDGTIKILDFGLARLEHGGLTSHDATTAGRLIGTLDYLAPEQASGNGLVDAKCDLYGLGATLFRLLAGCPPHGSSHSQPILQYLQQLTHQEPLPIEQFRSDLPDGLCMIVGQLLARDPHQRPDSAAELAESLRPFAENADLKELASQSIPDATEWGESDSSTVGSTDAIPPNVSSPSPVSSAHVLPAPQTMPVRRRPLRAIVIAAALLSVGVFFGWAGVTLWINTGEASVEIVSEVDDVTLELVRDGKVAREIEVHPGEKVSRVRVGKYELRIAGGSDHVRIDQKGLVLMRGDQRVVRVTQVAKSPPKSATTGPLDELIALKERLARDEAKVEELRKQFSDEHPAMVEITKKLEHTREEIIRIATGDDPNAQTSKGRTYRQWTDIVTRETDPATIVDGINALSKLNKPDNHQATRGTLIKVAKWNESRRSTVPCDDYISYLSNSRIEPPSQGIRNDPRAPRVERDYNWEQLFPVVPNDWRDVIDAILASMETIPEQERDSLEAIVSETSSSAKTIALLDAVKNKRKQDPDFAKTLAERLVKDDQPVTVRAVAHYVWLGHLKEEPGPDQRAAIASQEQTLVKTVLGTLMSKGQCPFGREMGTACARMFSAEISGFGVPLREMAKRSLVDRESFLDSQEFQLLQACGDAIVTRLGADDGPLMGRIVQTEVVEMLACGDLLRKTTRDQASEMLHDQLTEQLGAREPPTPPETFDESTYWTMTAVRTLAALDGQLPPELKKDRFRMADEGDVREAFDDWAGEFRVRAPRAAASMTLWLSRYPQETMDAVFKIVAQDLRSQISDAPVSARVSLAYGRWMPEARLLEQISIGIALPCAATHTQDDDTAYVLGVMLEQQMRRGIDEIQLTVPLRAHSDTLLRFAERDSVGSARGVALRLAQIGGADEDQVRTLAMQRVTAKRPDDEKERPDANSHEFAWMMECLAQSDPSKLTDEQVATINDQLMTRSFMSSGAVPSDLERCVTAALAIGRREGGPDTRIVKLGLGMSVSAFRANWSSSRSGRSGRNFTVEDVLWRRIGGSAPVSIVRLTLETLAEYPVDDPEILSSLEQMLRRLNTTGNHADSETAISIGRAIAAIERRIADD